MEAASGLKAASGIGEILQEGAAGPACLMALRISQAPGHGDTIGLSLVCP